MAEILVVLATLSTALLIGHLCHRRCRPELAAPCTPAAVPREFHLREFQFRVTLVYDAACRDDALIEKTERLFDTTFEASNWDSPESYYSATIGDISLQAVQEASNQVDSRAADADSDELIIDLPFPASSALKQRVAQSGLPWRLRQENTYAW